MAVARFSLDPKFGVIAESISSGSEALVAWLLADIGGTHEVCLDALATIDDVAAGREFEPWSSDAYEVTIAGSGLTLKYEWEDRIEGKYTLDQARTAVEEYWRFLQSLPEHPTVVRNFRPDLPTAVAAVLSWERTWQRPHPYRGRIEGIPAQGLE